MWHTSVQDLASWTGATTSDLVLCDIIQRYLMGQGEVTMMDCLEANASGSHEMVAGTHNKLAWDNFVGGIICRFFLEVVAPTSSRRSRMTPERWGRKLVSLLMQEIHEQRLFRKLHVYCRNLEGLMEEQHLLIFQKVEELMLTDPADLLPQHRLLLEGDFTELSKGLTLHRQCWITSMELAIEGKKRMCSLGDVCMRI